MIKLLILSLALGSCSCIQLIDGGTGYGEVIWVNGSDHTIRMEAQGGYALNITLAPGGQCLNDRAGQSNLPLERCGFDQLDVYFDEDIHLPYRREPTEDGNRNAPLMPPADYSSPINLYTPGRYTSTYRQEGPLLLTIETYTFTNADYEIAREWAEKQ